MGDYVTPHLCPMYNIYHLSTYLSGWHLYNKLEVCANTWHLNSFYCWLLSTSGKTHST